MPINSFFAAGLDILSEVNYLGTPLEQYLSNAMPPRQDILKNHAAMKSCLLANNIPLARWPSESSHHLMLAQQAVVSHIDSHFKSNNGLVAVNGPPGTGKTTLLCDVIANIVVHRAIKIAQLNLPREAFLGKTNIQLRDKTGFFFPIDPLIVAGTGIIVSSYNNSAVENISKELPLKSKLSKHFQETGSSADYFRKVANNVFNEFKNENEDRPDAWGLISVALGNMKNRSKVSKALFGKTKKDNVESAPPSDLSSLIEIIEASIEADKAEDKQESLVESWKKEKVVFQKTLANVQEAIAKCVEIENKIDTGHVLTKLIDSLEKELIAEQGRHGNKKQAIEENHAQITEQIKGRQVAGEQKETEYQSLLLDIDELNERTNLILIENTLNVIERLTGAIGMRSKSAQQKSKNISEARLKKINIEKIRAEKAQNLKNNAQEITRATDKLKEESIKYKNEAELHETTVTTNKTRKRSAEGAISANSQFILQFCLSSNIQIPDASLFAKTNDERHLSSVWVSEAFDTLRSELFLSALRLHELTIRAEGGKTKSNLMMIQNMLGNNISRKVRSADFELIWNSFFFIVPVVSTTLASFDRLFEKLSVESLGWLLIDEAGQATPQSIASALWRSKKAVIIGDPLQIEPVMTVPPSIIAELEKHYQVDIAWSTASESAQTIADRTMGLGAYIGATTWTGLPLRGHRRCVDPMFKVSNAIAYDHQMVQTNLFPGNWDAALPPSAWLDVRGGVANEKVIIDEMNALALMLQHFKLAWPADNKGAQASLYVICPFKQVAEACHNKIKELYLHNKVASGTVHTFQGKEADIVIIVLGSKPGKEGQGSRNWAAKKPNILNVALTRAKSRVYIIGNAYDWKSCPQFDVLHSELASTQQVYLPEKFSEAMAKINQGKN